MESSASVAWSSDSQCAAACSDVAGACGVVGSHCASQSAKGGLLASSELSIVAVLTCACCGTPRGALPHGGALRCGCALAAPPCCAGAAAAAAHAWTAACAVGSSAAVVVHRAASKRCANSLRWKQFCCHHGCPEGRADRLCAAKVPANTLFCRRLAAHLACNCSIAPSSHGQASHYMHVAHCDNHVACTA